jgi:short chain dehydrogenase
MTVVLITGAFTGIGRATALAFAKEGDQLVVSGRHGDTGAELVGEIRALGAEVEFICADVLRRSKVLRAACASTPWRRGRSRPRCSTASRAVARERQTSSTACRPSGRRRRKRSPTRSCSWPAMRLSHRAVHRRRWGQNCRVTATLFSAVWEDAKSCSGRRTADRLSQASKMEKAMDQPDFEVLVLEPALCRTRVPGTLNLIRGLNRWHGQRQ